MDVDHLQPSSQGGADDWRNYAPAHASCNRRKGNVVTHAGLPGQLALAGIGALSRAPATEAQLEAAARNWIVRTLRSRGEAGSEIMQEWVEFLRDRLRGPYTNNEYVALWVRLGKELGVKYTDRAGRWVVTLRPKESR
jgi:HNH endonuclease